MAKGSIKKISKKTREKKTNLKNKESKKTQKSKLKGNNLKKLSKGLGVSAKSLSPSAAPQKTSKSLEPQTMSELLAKTGYQLRGLHKGEEVEGIITEIGKNKMFIDIGAKTEGVVLEKEFELAKEMIKTLKPGDKIRVVIGVPENEKGQILLSLRRTNENYKWALLEKCFKEGKEIEVRGLDVNKGGMIARFMNIYGFIPASQFGRQHLGNLNNLYNKTFKVKIIELDRSKNRLIFSEKAVSEAQALAAQEKAIKLVKVADVLEGVVSGIMPFGIFVRVDVAANLFLEGLVHISEVSWEKVESLNKLYKVGDKLKVKVLGIDHDSKRLNLSIKQLQADPWLEIAQKYPVDKKVVGTVSKLAAFGAFVQLEKNLEGLIHISKIPADFEIKVGNKIEVYVEKVDLESHRIALGLVLSKKPVGYK